jgi:hypothetical protein
MNEPTATTIFDALIASIRSAAVHNKDDVVPPAAILSTDEKREFERLLSLFAMRCPTL